MKNVRLIKSKSSTMPWEVRVNAAAFGQRIRKRFKTKAEADRQMVVYRARLESKERTPLDPEVHKVVALFADRLTASQMMVCLSEGAERFGMADSALDELGKEFTKHQEMLRERGSVGKLYLKDVKGRVAKLVRELANPSI